MALQYPDAPTLSYRQQWLLALFVAVYLVCSIYLMIPFSIGCVGSGYTGLDSSPYGTPARPFVYRALIPEIARLVRAAIPAFIEKPATAWLIHWRDSAEGKAAVKHLFLSYRQPPISDDRIFETAIVALVCFLTLLAFLWMLFTLARALFPDSLAYALLAPLIALQLIPALTVENGYIYDFAELFFSCACFYLLFRQRWGMYLACLAVATLNKETTVFEIFFFCVWFYSRLPRTLFIRLLLLQIAIYAVVKGGLFLWYAHVPGSVNAFYLPKNIAYFRKHALLTAESSALAAALLLPHWGSKPEFLHGGLWLLLPNGAAFLVSGLYDEYRAFYWSLPILILLATHTLLAIGGFADHPLLATQPKERA